MSNINYRNFFLYLRFDTMLMLVKASFLTWFHIGCTILLVYGKYYLCYRFNKITYPRLIFLLNVFFRSRNIRLKPTKYRYLFTKFYLWGYKLIITSCYPQNYFSYFLYKNAKIKIF